MADRDVDLLAEEYAEQWPEDSTDDAARLARAYLLERFKYEHEHKAAGIYRERLEADEARLAAVAALADEWEADRGILSPDSRYTRDVLVRELRAALAPDAAPSDEVEGEAARIEDLIERSSLGTPEAKALRATVSDERAARIVALAACMADAPNPTHSWTPEDPCACGSPDTCPATPAAPTDEGARLGEGLSEEERVAPQGEEFVRGIVWAAYEGGMWCGECDPADQDDDCCVLPQRIRKRILADRARGLGGDHD